MGEVEIAWRVGGAVRLEGGEPQEGKQAMCYCYQGSYYFTLCSRSSIRIELELNFSLAFTLQTKNPNELDAYSSVQYFLSLTFFDRTHHLALVKPFVNTLFKDPYGVVVSCQPGEELQMLRVNEIVKVVAAIPRPRLRDWFIAEQVASI